MDSDEEATSIWLYGVTKTPYEILKEPLKRGMELH